MDASLEQPLVDVKPRSNKRRLVVAACSGGLALAAYGAFTGVNSQPNTMTGLAVFPAGNSTECWQMTGGSCRVLNCYASRGPTQCYKELLKGYNCVCKDGYCSGADGSCYPTQNKLIASGVTLSADYAGYDYYLVATSCHALEAATGAWLTPTKVSEDGTGPDAKWSIWQLPGDNPAYMLVPDLYPDCVVSEDYEKGLTGFRHNIIQTMGPWHWGMHGEGLHYNDRGPGYASWMIKKAEGGRYTFSLYSDGGLLGKYLYISSRNNYASIWSGTLGSVGKVGEWKVTPPLPDSIGA